MYRPSIFLLFFVSSLNLLFSQDLDEITSDSVIISNANKYKLKYKANCVDEKITDNRGNGYDSLYGTRNFRPILHGVAYRGGGNNYYHRANKRSNKNPLPLDGLNSLLKNGFSKSVYLYRDNFESAPKFVINNDDTLNYYQISGNTPSELDSILMFTYNSIVDNDTGPIYLHCWNGWHQSGYVSAVLLKQFCGYNNKKSLHYWEDCADNWTRGYDRIRDAIRNFKPIDKYKISEEISDAICPCYIDSRENDSVVVNNNDELKSLKIEVNFPLNISDLPPSVSTFLDEYANMLKVNRYFSVEVRGHTDSRGNDKFNLTLSSNRAKNVYDYLLRQNVDSSQISYKGYGEKKIKNKCKNNVTCNEMLHSENRRVEFSIKKISYQINFKKNNYLITSKDKLILNEIKLMLSSNENVIVEIGGHADAGSGTDFVNNNISYLRAESVFNYLKINGLDMSNITFKGYGSSRTIYNDKRDRRIEFMIIENE